MAQAEVACHEHRDELVGQETVALGIITAQMELAQPAGNSSIIASIISDQMAACKRAGAMVYYVDR